MTAVLWVGLLVRSDIVKQSALAERGRDDRQATVSASNSGHRGSVQLYGVPDVRELVKVDILATSANSGRRRLRNNARRVRWAMERDFVVRVRPEGRLEDRVAFLEFVRDRMVQVASNRDFVCGFLLVDRDDVRLIGWRYASLLNDLRPDNSREPDLTRLIYDPEY